TRTMPVIPNYGQVAYQGVYPGINPVYHGNQGWLEYDFVVAPGADPGTIQMRVQGAQGLSLAARGNLVVHAPGGDLVEQAPVLYQEVNGTRQAVSGRFVLEGSNQVGFQVGPYDPTRALVIDPRSATPATSPAPVGASPWTAAPTPTSPAATPRVA